MKIKDAIKDALFKENTEILLTRENIEDFIGKLGTLAEATEQKEEDLTWGKFKPEDLPRIADNVVADLVMHMVFVEFAERVMKDYKEGKLDHAPLYTTQEQIDKYKIESCKLFHSLCIKLRMARMFGFGDIESIVKVVDTGKLPSIKKAKKMKKEQLDKAMKSAESVPQSVDVDSTKMFDTVLPLSGKVDLTQYRSNCCKAEIYRDGFATMCKKCKKNCMGFRIKKKDEKATD
jgi:hypothetical protein